jgi:uncharacterized UBP type Zn finger protein
MAKEKPEQEPVEIDSDQTVTAEMKAEREEARKNPRPVPKLVVMENEKGMLADVHPKEVENWEKAGWRKKAGKKTQGDDSAEKE